MKLNSSLLPCADAQNKTMGRWTKEEHERFIEGIRKYGKNWKKVEEFVGTRNGAQIRSHAQKFFQRIKREELMDESDSKSLGDKIRFSRQQSDYSEITSGLLLGNSLSN